MIHPWYMGFLVPILQVLLQDLENCGRTIVIPMFHGRSSENIWIGRTRSERAEKLTGPIRAFSLTQAPLFFFDFFTGRGSVVVKHLPKTC